MAMVMAAAPASAVAALSSAAVAGVFWVVELWSLNHRQILIQKEEGEESPFLPAQGLGFGCEPSSRSPQRRSFRWPLL